MRMIFQISLIQQKHQLVKIVEIILLVLIWTLIVMKIH
jgi:hypothetical protein